MAWNRTGAEIDRSKRRIPQGATQWPEIEQARKKIGQKEENHMARRNGLK